MASATATATTASAAVPASKSGDAAKPIAVITGANRGLGLGLVVEMVKRGYRVIATARDVSKATELQAVAKAGSVEVAALDVSDLKSCTALATALQGTGSTGVPRIDVLINNAGVGHGATLATVTAADFTSVYTANVIGPAQITQQLLPLLRKSSHARVMHVSSDFGSIEVTAKQPNFPKSSVAYRCSKAALNQLAAVQAREFNDKVDEPTVGLSSSAAMSSGVASGRVTVLAVHPGWVRTDMGGDAAPLDIATSTAQMAKVVDEAPPCNTLRFVDYQGKHMPF